MKKWTIYLLLLVLTGLLSSCGLGRDNPLDPNGDPTIVVPEIISNLELFPSPPRAPNKFVELRWSANPAYSTDGYYIYRGLGYFATFTIVDTVYVNNASHGSKPWHRVMPGEYWYKVSGFKEYPSGRLEGRACKPVWVNVPI